MTTELSMGRTVLCVSKTSPAQLTRNMILERAGYKIISTTSPDAAVRIFTGSPIDAVVFGDSIPADQRLELALKFKSLNPSVPIIALSSSSGSQFASGIVDEQLESLGDPQLLVEAVKHVLARNGEGPGEDTIEKSPEVPTRLN
jgi:CheY-like chemotaxis protein